ncbi:LexA/Signal peptidase [Amylostereum chailletii]|nr:LexA/Signal peptidase [Amylostereum chailletii]
MQWLRQGFNHVSSTLRQTSPRSTFLGVLYVINASCACHLFVEYVGAIQHVAGPSMLPTMAESGEVVIENRLSVRLNPRKFRRGDLVTYESPLEPGRRVCKRILGLPGDIVCVDPTGMKAPSTEHTVVPTGHIWAIGDNAAMSRDSRDYGPVSMSLIRGTLWARLYPFSRMTIFKNNMSYID